MLVIVPVRYVMPIVVLPPWHVEHLALTSVLMLTDVVMLLIMCHLNVLILMILPIVIVVMQILIVVRYDNVD